MQNREDLIKALSGAFQTDSEKKADPGYHFEEVMINNVRASRITDIKPTAIRARELSGDMSLINSLSQYLQGLNSADGRRVDRKLQELCAKAEGDEVLFGKLAEIAKDATTRFLSMSPNSPQRVLLPLHIENSLNKLEQ